MLLTRPATSCASTDTCSTLRPPPVVLAAVPRSSVSFLATPADSRPKKLLIRRWSGGGAEGAARARLLPCAGRGGAEGGLEATGGASEQAGAAMQTSNGGAARPLASSAVPAGASGTSSGRGCPAGTPAQPTAGPTGAGGSRLAPSAGITRRATAGRGALPNSRRRASGVSSGMLSHDDTSRPGVGVVVAWAASWGASRARLLLRGVRGGVLTA